MNTREEGEGRKGSINIPCIVFRTHKNEPHHLHTDKYKHFTLANTPHTQTLSPNNLFTQKTFTNTSHIRTSTQTKNTSHTQIYTHAYKHWTHANPPTLTNISHTQTTHARSHTQAYSYASTHTCTNFTHTHTHFLHGHKPTNSYSQTLYAYKPIHTHSPVHTHVSTLHKYFTPASQMLGDRG